MSEQRAIETVLDKAKVIRFQPSGVTYELQDPWKVTGRLGVMDQNSTGEVRIIAVVSKIQLLVERDEPHDPHPGMYDIVEMTFKHKDRFRF